jgi:hypothetical protein
LDLDVADPSGRERRQRVTDPVGRRSFDLDRFDDDGTGAFAVESLDGPDVIEEHTPDHGGERNRRRPLGQKTPLMEGSCELAEGGDRDDESPEGPAFICRSDREILADSSGQFEVGWGKKMPEPTGSASAARKSSRNSPSGPPCSAL